MKISKYCVATFFLLTTLWVNATQIEEAAPASAEKSAETQPSMSMSEIIALLQQQQKDLAEQQKLLTSQSQLIVNLTRELDVLRTPTPMKSEVISSDSATGTVSENRALSTEKLAIATDKPAQTTAQKKEEAGESVTKAQTDDPTRDLLADFTGAWRLPGTNAALAIGGYVKATVVNSFDALEIKDRFIVGSIPVGEGNEENAKAQSSITASQSRLNFDLREPTDVGVLRAFIEGDFAGTDETFRLRHAFGQWNRVLAGKTWSAFVDTEASPEEVDFEGLNGRINVRQSQVRIIPGLGEKYEFQLSLEDPNPQVQNGQGITRTPDVVASARFQPYPRLHVKVGLLARQIRAQIDPSLGLGTGSDDKSAWGLTLSGRFITPALDKRDSLLFQINAGNGIGRYVNDLSTVGSFDGVFDPVNGDLELFDVVSGYTSYQHWWGRNSMRSNFTVGVVEVDNPEFVEGNAYKRTLRFSSNLMWSPTPRIDLGAEYLWGNRKNEDGENDDATQIQVAARYRF
ncbi:MAG: DcaP family trimeric outer membrane transporter [Halioglobus sp.]